MAYLLSVEDRQRITYLEKLGSRLLDRLNVRFTHARLEQTLYRKYVQLLSSSTTTSATAEDMTVADKDDPSNLALVLLEAMKEYHIHSAVADKAEFGSSTTTLVIMTKDDDKKTFRHLLGFVDDPNSIQRIAEPAIPFRPESIENVVVFGRSAYSAEENYKINNARLKLKQAFLIFATLLLSIIIVKAIQHAWSHYPLWLWMPTLVLLAAGVFISINLFRLEKMSAYMSDWARKVCSAGKEFSCQKVLGSPGSKVFGIISMTDIGITYFSGLLGFTLLGLIGNNAVQYLVIVCWCSVLVLPYTLFSIYYQASVVKKFCPLCLIVQGILWLHAGYLLVISPGLLLWPVATQALAELAIVMTIVVSIYFLFASHLRLQLQHNRLQASGEALKNNPAVFTTLLELQPSFEAPELPGLIMLGDAKAPARFDVILSLTCKACGDKLEEVTKLADWFGESISVAIHITPDPYNAAVIKKLLEHSLRNNYTEAITVLDHWFVLLKTNITFEAALAKWRQQYVVESKDAHTDYVYELYQDWHRDHFIPHTPFLVYNGRVLPHEYNHMPALKNIIEQLIEQEHETEEQQ
jgi:uncharacterized membrane protein